MDTIIDGIHVKSYITDLKTGTTKPCDSSMAKLLLKSILKQMPVNELISLPKAPKGINCDYEASLINGELKWQNS